MTNIIAIFPEDRPRFVVGADDFLDNRQPFLAVHARSSSVCLTYHNVSRDELAALAERIRAFLADDPPMPDADALADEQAFLAEARRITLERWNQAVDEAYAAHSPTGTLPD